MSKEATRASQCPSCGAPARAEAARCDYCRSRLATVSCPSCFGLLFEGAAFCQHCGAARARVDVGDGHGIKCPACQGSMTWIRVGDTDLLECAGCDGTWIEAETFERVCADRDRQAAMLHGLRGDSGRPSVASGPVRYRPCPRCARLMNRVNFARLSGAVVDVCKGHGTFLDRGELHQIVRFIQQGGMDRAREAERQRLADEHSLHALLAALNEHKTDE